MTILTLNKQQLESQIGEIDEKMQDKISMFGTPVENITETEISIEIFPNRPDLLSLQGLLRALTAFFKKPGLKKYKVESSREKLIIEKSLPEQWPYALACIVKGIKFDDEKIKEVIDIQEKIGASYHRNRKKGGLGLYPLTKIKFPIRFIGMKPEEIKFRPLEFPKEINGRQILSQHPTGREYGHICKDWKVFPVFIDSNNIIMSMPPIINSHNVGKIDENTKDVFIEATGNDYNALKLGINMLVTALADMGGKIYSIDCEYKGGKKIKIPDLEPEKMSFSIENINKTLGLELDEKQIKNLFAKMGIGYEKTKSSSTALIPAYRTDVLHEIDLSEEIAIAYGYNNFQPEIPDISTIGEEDSTAIFKHKVAEILIGLGLLEISTYHLSTKEKQFKKIGIKDFKNQMIEVLDSKTENNILRTSLLAQSIQILSENSDAEYPQKIFELGKIFYHDDKSETQIGEKENLCISLCHEKANFTEIKQVLDYLIKMLNINYEIRETQHPSFINGRCGEIIINNKPVGVLGEINPTVLKNNKIKMPTASLEISIENLHFQ